MLSHPQPDCRPLNSSSSSDDLEPAEAAPAWIRVASCVFTIFALLYTITDTATKNRKTGVEADIDAEYSYTGFHCTFAFGIAQLVMVLTGKVVLMRGTFWFIHGLSCFPMTFS
eukprot:SAG11_NODE_743_length_7407_cov_2.941434_9_plen_113_part_00